MDQFNLTEQILEPCAAFTITKTAGGLTGTVQMTHCNRLYQDYIKTIGQETLLQSREFEAMCFQAVSAGKQRQIRTKISSGFLDVEVIPTRPEREDQGSCLVILREVDTSSADQFSAVSTSTAEAAIRASLTLMEADDFEHGVQQVLRDIIAISSAVVSRIFLLDHDLKHVRMYSSAVSIDGVHRKNDALTYDFIRQWERCTVGKRVVVVTTPQDYAELGKTNPEWVADLTAFGVKTIALIPLRHGKELYGFVDILDFDPQKAGVVQELGGLISIYLGTEISNHLLLDRLEEMSTTDALTGLKNRTAMLQTMSRIEGAACGIVNLDLNGLKTVNDTMGHDAGDRLLILAAEALKKVYYVGDIHRTGGDEFIVLLPGIGEETFYRKLERFKAAMEKNNEVRFAIGAYWSDGSMALSTAFRMADDAMYADKKAFYQAHPELRQR